MYIEQRKFIAGFGEEMEVSSFIGNGIEKRMIDIGERKCSLSVAANLNEKKRMVEVVQTAPTKRGEKARKIQTL